METKKMLSRLAGFGVLACVLGLAPKVAAVTNGVVVIMDQAGSMTENTTIDGVTQAKYLFARDLVEEDVNAYVADREYELWSFQHTASVNPYEVLFSFEDGASMSVYQRQRRSSIILTPYQRQTALPRSP